MSVGQTQTFSMVAIFFSKTVFFADLILRVFVSCLYFDLVGSNRRGEGEGKGRRGKLRNIPEASGTLPFSEPRKGSPPKGDFERSLSQAERVSARCPRRLRGLNQLPSRYRAKPSKGVVTCTQIRVRQKGESDDAKVRQASVALDAGLKRPGKPPKKRSRNKPTCGRLNAQGRRERRLVAGNRGIDRRADAPAARTQNALARVLRSTRDWCPPLRQGALMDGTKNNLILTQGQGSRGKSLSRHFVPNFLCLTEFIRLAWRSEADPLNRGEGKGRQVFLLQHLSCAINISAGVILEEGIYLKGDTH